LSNDDYNKCVPSREYEDRPDPHQVAIFASMTIERKIQCMTDLREGAIRLKRATLPQVHPGITQAQIEQRIRQWYINGTP